MDRNGLRAGPHFQFHAMVLPQQPELFQIIGAVEIRSGQRGLEATGAGNEAVTQARVFQLVLPHYGIRVNPHERITGPDMSGQAFAGHEALHRGAQMANLLRIDFAHLGQRGGGVAVPTGGNEGRHVGHCPLCNASCGWHFRG